MPFTPLRVSPIFGGLEVRTGDLDITAGTITASGNITTSEGNVVVNGREVDTVREISGNTIVLYGDSVIQQGGPILSGGIHMYTGRGWFNWLNAKLNQPFNVIINTAIPGYTSQDMLNHINDKVIVYSPDYCLLPLTTNDFNNLEDTTENVRARYIQMFDALIEAGIKVIAATCLSSVYFFTQGDTTKKIREWQETNRWLRDYVQANPHILLIDIANYTIDAETGYPQTNTTDGTHPYEMISFTAGRDAANEISNLIKPVSRLPITNIDPHNVLSNGMMLGDNAGIATGYTISDIGGTQTPSKITTREDGKVGEVQVIECTVAATDMFSFDSPTSALTLSQGIQAGKMVFGMIEVEVVTDSSFVFLYSELTFMNAESTVLKTAYGNYYDSANPEMDIDEFDGIIITPSAQVPTGSTQAKLRLCWNGTGTIKIKRMFVSRDWSLDL